MPIKLKIAFIVIFVCLAFILAVGVATFLGLIP